MNKPSTSKPTTNVPKYIPEAIVRNIVRVEYTHYDLEDPCKFCGSAFECNPDGSTKAAAYLQISSQSLRACNRCGNLQEWVLKKGKQGFLHTVDHEYSIPEEKDYE